MIFAYIRVSTDKQTVENQRFELINLAQKRGFTIDSWTEETISGTKKIEDRKLHLVLKKLRTGDMLLVSELSRLGRNLMMIMGILHTCMEKDIRVLTAKEGYELGDNISSKVLAFAFGLSAEIERNLISQRTREGLARRKAAGQVLGRPKGKKTKLKKLDNNEHLRSIRRLLNNGVSVSAIGRLLNVHRMTVTATIKEYNLRDPSAKIPEFATPAVPIELPAIEYVDLCQPDPEPGKRPGKKKTPIEKVPLFKDLSGDNMSQKFSFYQQLIATAEACELKTISDDDCCRLLAWLYVFGSEYEAVLFNMKLNTDIITAQRRLNIGPSLTPNPSLFPKLKAYLHQVEPLLRKRLPIPDWCQQVNKRYGLPPLRE